MNLRERMQQRRDSFSRFQRFIHDYGIRPFNFWGNFYHPIQTARYQWLCFTYGIRNLWRFRKAVWRFDTCDYSGLLDLMQIATKQMADGHRENGHLVSSERSARQLLIVSELCRRLKEDDYETLAGYERFDQMSDIQRTQWARHTGYLGKQDADYLGKMFRYVQGWWD